MPRPMCETCKAFYPLSRECRRHAPVMVPVPQGAQLAAMGMYPATEPTKGCCEHIPDDAPRLQ